MMRCDIGVIGLGTMGRNLARNLLDQCFHVACYDKDEETVSTLKAESERATLCATTNLKGFIDSLRPPRNVMLLVPSGPAVDSVIEELVPLLEPDDLLLDCGNSFFIDTEQRQERLAEQNFHLLGVGISGGPEDARKGPSIMPGGDRQAFERVRFILEAISAKIDEKPCIDYIGPRGAGHFVKMVHNGIEYGVMQLIAETYHLMHQGLGLDNDALRDLYKDWSNSSLNSYLLEITADIVATVDKKTGDPLVELIVDAARQKGTGMWTSQCAMDLQVPVPTIDMGVAMRNLSAREQVRRSTSHALQGPSPYIRHADGALRNYLRNAYLGALILTYAQGFALLQTASRDYSYDLSLESIASLWRGGCIIRAGILEDIMRAFEAHPDLPNLLMDVKFAGLVIACQSDLRRIVCAGAELGIPLPGFMVSLAYFDGFRNDWVPANLIQAQRDSFGSHGFERVDLPGSHHAAWRGN